MHVDIGDPATATEHDNEQCNGVVRKTFKMIFALAPVYGFDNVFIQPTSHNSMLHWIRDEMDGIKP